VTALIDADPLLSGVADGWRPGRPRQRPLSGRSRDPSLALRSQPFDMPSSSGSTRRHADVIRRVVHTCLEGVGNPSCPGRPGGSERVGRRLWCAALPRCTLVFVIARMAPSHVVGRPARGDAGSLPQPRNAMSRPARSVTLLLFAVALSLSSAGTALAASLDEPVAPADVRATLVESQMTLTEKAQLTAACSLPRRRRRLHARVPRLGIPNLNLAGAGMGVSDVCNRSVDGRRPSCRRRSRWRQLGPGRRDRGRRAHRHRGARPRLRRQHRQPGESGARPARRTHFEAEGEDPTCRAR